MRYKGSNVKQEEYLDGVAEKFDKRKTSFYACHCTGDEAFEYLDKRMHNIFPLHVGSKLYIGD